MNNLFNLNFSYIKIELGLSSDLSVDNFNYPGIFAVQNKESKRILLVSADNILVEIYSFLEDFKKGKIKSQDLLEDFKKSGKEIYKFFVLEADYTFDNRIKRNYELTKYKDICGGNLYH